jgi:hypothetical protein
MSRAAFTQADITRAVRGALKAVDNGEKGSVAVDFPPGGGFRLLIGKAVSPLVTDRGNEWDEVLR